MTNINLNEKEKNMTTTTEMKNEEEENEFITLQIEELENLECIFDNENDFQKLSEDPIKCRIRLSEVSIFHTPICGYFFGHLRPAAAAMTFSRRSGHGLLPITTPSPPVLKTFIFFCSDIIVVQEK